MTILRGEQERVLRSARPKCLALALVACLAIGCGKHETMRGSLIYSDGVSIRCLTLPERETHELFAQHGQDALVGFAMINQDSLIWARDLPGSSEAAIVELLDLRRQVASTIGRGRFPTYISKTRTVAYFAEPSQPGAPCSLATISLSAPSQRRIVSLGPSDSTGYKWWNVIGAPVETSPGVLAFVGADRMVWTWSAGQGAPSRVGFPGLVPRLWIAGQGTLICDTAWDVRGELAVNLDSGTCSTLPRLDRMSGWAAINGGSRFFFAKSSARWIVAEGYDLYTYDLTRGVPKRAVTGFLMVGPAVWQPSKK